MLIPRIILQIHNRGKVIKDMRAALVVNSWKREEIFNSFMLTKNWDVYKREEAQKIVQRKPKLRSTRIEDIPTHIRENHPNYFSF